MKVEKKSAPVGSQGAKEKRDGPKHNSTRKGNKGPLVAADVLTKYAIPLRPFDLLKPLEPWATAVAPTLGWGNACNDIGNAKRLAAILRNRVGKMALASRYYRRWRWYLEATGIEDDVSEWVFGVATLVSKSLHAEARQNPALPALSRWAITSGNLPRLKAMVELCAKLHLCEK